MSASRFMTVPLCPTSSSPALPIAAFDPLDDEDLLVLLLRRTSPQAEVESISRDLLHRFGSVAAVVAADPAELTRTEGLGGIAVGDLKLLQMLCTRLCRAEASRRPVISSWAALQTYVRTALAHLPREQFRALYLDRRNSLLRDELVADGTVDHAPVYVATVVDCYLALTAGQGITSSTQCRPRGAGR